MANKNLSNEKTSNYPLHEDAYVDLAEEVIAGLLGSGSKLLTTSQIRNLFALSADIYNRIKIAGDSEETLEKELRERLQYFRVRLLYEAGRDDKVKTFIERAKLLSYIKATRTYHECLLLCRYMEALVAYYSYMVKV